MKLVFCFMKFRFIFNCIVKFLQFFISSSFFIDNNLMTIISDKFFWQFMFNRAQIPTYTPQHYMTNPIFAQLLSNLLLILLFSRINVVYKWSFSILTFNFEKKKVYFICSKRKGNVLFSLIFSL